MNVIKGSKGAEILVFLIDRDKYVQEIQNKVGGSATTVEDRIGELIKEGLVNENISKNFPFKRILSLTKTGKTAAQFVNMMNNIISKKGGLPEIRQKWLLSLIYSLKQIKGKTRIEKLLFLLSKEFNLDLDNFYEFQPERWGPFSQEVIEDVVQLNKLEIVKITVETFKPNDPAGEVVQGWNFELTDDGEKIAKEINENLSKNIKEAMTSLKKFNDMPLKKLLKYVHKKYKEFSL
jgi:DNA-binding HxlR family transcriptional regulator